MKKSFFKKIFSILLCVALLFCGACEEEYEDSQQVLEIASGAFRYCESLKEIAFSGCQSIQKLVLHKDVLAIERYAFHNCSSLAEISYTSRSRLRVIESNAFYGFESLLELQIPESVSYIGRGAFANCTSATFYCEVQSKPNTWIDNWNPLNRSVIWGYTEESTASSSSTGSSNNSNSSAS